MPPCLIKVVGNWPEKLIKKIVWPYTDIITFLTCVKTSRGSRGRDRMVVGFSMLKFDSDLRQVSGFLWVLRVPPPIKLTARI